MIYCKFIITGNENLTQELRAGSMTSDLTISFFFKDKNREHLTKRTTGPIQLHT